MSELTLCRGELLVELQESDTISGLILVVVEGKTRLSLRMKDGVLVINTEYTSNLSQPTSVEINQEIIKVGDYK